MKRNRMSPDEWAEQESRAQARIARLREIETRGRAKLAAERRETAARRRRLFLFR